jgi:hypothetical protein
VSERRTHGRAVVTTSPDSTHAGTLRLAIALTLTAVALFLLPRPGAAQDWRTLASSRQTAGEDLLKVGVKYGAGRLDIAPGTPGSLYRASMRYDADTFRPRVNYSSGRLDIGVEGGTARGRNLRGGQLDLKLAPDVPVELQLEFGAAEAAVELGGLRIRSASISTGASVTTMRVSTPNPETCRELLLQVGAARFEAIGLSNLNAEQVTVKGGVGEVVLDFTGTPRNDMTARVEMGLGALTLRVPKSLGLRVARGGLLTSFDSQGLVKRGDVFFSENWESAANRLSLSIDAAFGTIRVVWVD